MSVVCLLCWYMAFVIKRSGFLRFHITLWPFTPYWLQNYENARYRPNNYRRFLLMLSGSCKQNLIAIDFQKLTGSLIKRGSITIDWTIQQICSPTLPWRSLYSTLIVGNGLRIPTSIILQSSKSFSDDKNKAETLIQDFSLLCHFAYSGSFVTLLITNNARNMSKSTSYTGQPVYSQVIKLLEKPKFNKLVSKYYVASVV